MRALLTAVIAAIEAAAVALAVFAAIGIPAVLVWWRGFDLAAEPLDLAAAVAGLWQMTHLVPMQVAVSAQAALGMGLAPAELSFTLSLAPLALTLCTVLLAYRSGSRFAGRGGAGAWALLGGTAGFAAAAWLCGMLAAEYTVWPMWARIVVPAAVYGVPLVLGFVVRAAREDHDWWDALVRRLQQGVARVAPAQAAALPERAAEVFRLALVAVAAVAMLGTLGFTIAILLGYVDIIALSQGLQLDAFGALMLFVLQLAFIPTAWIWSVSWFAGSGFSVGAATSVTPFDTLLGPLPALPLLGAIPSSWGWVGGLAPVLIVGIGTVLGGLAGGRLLMRRSSAAVSATVPVLAAILAGLVIALSSLLASGSIGPGRLETNGPGWWQTGGLVALELAFGMSLGVFARRFDVARLRALVPSGLLEGESDLPLVDALDRDDLGATPDLAETIPIDPLSDLNAPAPPSIRRGWLPRRRTRTHPDSESASELDDASPDDQPTVEIEPLAPFGDSSPEEVVSETAPIELPAPSALQDAEGDGGIVPHLEPDLRAEAPSPDDADAESGPELEPESIPGPEPAEAVDPLLRAFSWDAEPAESPAPEAKRDWRSRMRSQWGRE